jgi:5-methylcytosine-specific restriction enzyme A
MRLPDRRVSAASRGYDARWRRARAEFLAEPENALCRMCLAEGLLTAAREVDHIIPHRGDQKLFWDRSNWQGICTSHHSAKSLREENARRGYRVVERHGCDSSGKPLGSHWWNRTG